MHKCTERYSCIAMVEGVIYSCTFAKVGFKKYYQLDEGKCAYSSL